MFISLDFTGLHATLLVFNSRECENEVLSNNPTADLNLLFVFLHDHPLWMLQFRNPTWSKTSHESAGNVDTTQECSCSKQSYPESFLI